MAWRQANILGLLASVVWGGCHVPVEPVGLTSQTFVLADEDQLDDLWETCQDVLRRNRFRLDRKDRRAGLLTTFPVTSQQFFEFWRHDVDTAYDGLEASLSTIRRRVAVAMQRQEGAPLASVISVTVSKERLSAPERQVNNSAAALRLFTSGFPGERGQPRLTATDDYWIGIGRDGAMERRLLAQIADEGIYVQTLRAPVE